MGIRTCIIVMATVGALAPAVADVAKPRPVPVPAKKPAEVEVGLTAGFKFVPASGFVDDPIGSDGKRLVFAVADMAKAELRTVDAETGAELAPPIDISKVTQKPIALHWLGDRVLVVGATGDLQLAALVDLKGKVIYKTPTVDRAALITRDGKQVVALHKVTPIKTGTRYSVELRAAATGKRIGVVKSIDVNGAAKSAKLDFTINHWTTGFTRAVGTKGGEWVKAENQRSPDVEASYDVITGKFVATAPITDLMEHRKRLAVLQDAAGKDPFVRMSSDLMDLELWQDGQRSVVTLDQPIMLYGDARRSLDVAVGAKTVWIALQIDPVNSEAVKNQKADVEYWDLYQLGDGGKATRRARIWAGGTRVRFGFAGDRLWVIDRNIGFDRGGKSLALYSVMAAP